MISRPFKRDLDRNIYCSHLRRKRWVLYFLRKEQDAQNPLVAKVFAFGKKVSLVGSGCELPASALLGAGLRLPHLNGIIISPMAKVGEDCTIFHQVTLGVNGRKSLELAPVVGNRVSIGAGAKLIGPISIGDDVVIGANAVVTKDVPPHATVVGYNRILT